MEYIKQFIVKGILDLTTNICNDIENTIEQNKLKKQIKYYEQEMEIYEKVLDYRKKNN